MRWKRILGKGAWSFLTLASSWQFFSKINLFTFSLHLKTCRRFLVILNGARRSRRISFVSPGDSLWRLIGFELYIQYDPSFLFVPLFSANKFVHFIPVQEMTLLHVSSWKRHWRRLPRFIACSTAEACSIHKNRGRGKAYLYIIKQAYWPLTLGKYQKLEFK